MPPAPRRRPLFLAVGAAGLVLLIFALTVGGGWQAFHRWRVGRLVQQAEGFLKIGDLRRTSLAAARARQIDPGNVPAARVLAEIAARAGQGAESLRWWGEVVKVQPDSVTDRLALAATALQFNAPAEAAQALAAVPPGARENAGWQSLAGALALRQGRTAEASRYFDEAAHREPGNASYRLNAAVLRLQATPDDATARDALAGLAANAAVEAASPLRVTARRTLFNAAVARGDRIEARRWGGELEGDAQATLDDRLAVVSFLRGVGDAAGEDALDRLLADAARGRNPDSVAALLTWMQGHGLARKAAAWAPRLPRAALVDGRRVQPALAACLGAAGSWAELKALCADPGANWGPEGEPLRHATLARALEGLGDQPAATAEWDAAVSAALRHAPAARALSAAARSWGDEWTRRLEGSLLAVTQKPAPDPNASAVALELLGDGAYARGDTRAMAGFVDQLAALRPSDPAVRNNRAALALLLQDPPPPEAVAEARALYDADPANPSLATTHAFALLRQHDAAGARRVLDALPPEQLGQPAIALYYGLALAAAPTHLEDRARATQFLERAKTAPLLPEERALVDEALRGLRR